MLLPGPNLSGKGVLGQGSKELANGVDSTRTFWSLTT